MIGAVAVLWIGVVLLMAEVTKNARPVFIVLGGVITLGLGYAWHDYNRKEENKKTGAEQPFMHPGPYDEQNQPVAFGPGVVPPGYPPYNPYFPYHHPGQLGPHSEIETPEMKEMKSKMHEQEMEVQKLKAAMDKVSGSDVASETLAIKIKDMERKLEKQQQQYDELKKQRQGFNPVDLLDRAVNRETHAARKARIKGLWSEHHEIIKVEGVDWWKKKGSSPPNFVKKVSEAHKGPNGED